MLPSSSPWIDFLAVDRASADGADQAVPLPSATDPAAVGNRSPMSPPSGVDLLIATSISGDVALLTLEGNITDASVPMLFKAIRRELTAHPGPVVCDLARVGTLSSAASTVFLRAVAACGGWPAAPLALAAPSKHVARTLRVTGARKFLVIRSSVDLAVRDAAAGPPILRDSLIIESSTAAQRGRAFLLDCARRWALPVPQEVADAALPLLEAAARRSKHRFELQVTFNRQKGVAVRAVVTTRSPEPLPPGLQALPHKNGGQILSSGTWVPTSAV